MSISVRKVYAHLKKIDQVDPATSAVTREEAQDILTQPGVSLARKQAIADRLNQANNRLGWQTTGNEDSY